GDVEADAGDGQNISPAFGEQYLAAPCKDVAAKKQRGSHEDHSGEIETAGRSQGAESGEDQEIEHHVEVAADGGCKGDLFDEREHDYPLNCCGIQAEGKGYLRVARLWGDLRTSFRPICTGGDARAPITASGCVISIFSVYGIAGGHGWRARKALLELNRSGIGPARRLPANPARSGRKQRQRALACAVGRRCLA